MFETDPGAGHRADELMAGRPGVRWEPTCALMTALAWLARGDYHNGRKLVGPKEATSCVLVSIVLPIATGNDSPLHLLAIQPPGRTPHPPRYTFTMRDSSGYE